jgi:dTDP-4-dehydrorhamnose reductase
MRVIVTGAAGQLGLVVVRRLQPTHDVIALTRAQLDVTRHDDVQRAVADARPHTVINCAAYNAVDAAEDDVLPALESNAFAVRSLARAVSAAGATLVHYSTDFVFDGDTETPYTERDPPAPKSVYGQTKLLGEWFAADAVRHYVIRVESLFGGPKPQSSVDRIIAALEAERTARVFTDRVVSPSYVDDVAVATERLLAGTPPFGCYHCVNSGHVTWYELALEIASILRCPPRFDATPAAAVQLRAPRPRFCALSNAKLAAAGIPMPTWQDALRRYLTQRDGRAA